MPNTPRRLEISSFEGINAIVAKNLATKTEFSHAENARSVTIGSIEKRSGQTILGSGIPSCSALYGLFDFHGRPASETFNGQKGLYCITVPTPGSTGSIYYYTNAGTYSPLPIPTDPSTGLPRHGIVDNITVDPAYPFSATIAEGKLFLANYVDDTRYIKTDGTTVGVPADTNSETALCPRAAKINYYKGCLYVANFVTSTLTGSTKYPNYFLKSSKPLGKIAVVTSDPVASADHTVEVSDTRYFYPGQKVEFYRGADILFGGLQLTVASVSETSVTFASPVGPHPVPYPTIHAADGIWGVGTFYGQPRFFWPRVLTVQGTNITTEDAWRVAGGTEGPITMMANVGNVMMVANESNCVAYNEILLQAFDTGVGCVSPNGYTRLLGKLFFLGDDGIYATDGSPPLLISQKVEPYIRGATKAGKRASAAGKKGRSVFFTLGDVTKRRPDGSTEKVLKDVCLEYNVTQEQWFVHTGVKAGMFATFVDTLDTDRLILIPPIGATNRLYPTEFLGPTNEGDGDTNCTDFGDAIPFVIESPDLTLASMFENYNYPKNLCVECERGSTAEGFVSVDQGGFYAVDGKILKGANILRIVGSGPDRSKPPRARSMKISIRDSSKQICKFTKIGIVYDETEQNNPEMPSELV